MLLYNTLSQNKEEFRSLKKNQTSIYVCGITPYDTTHLGHAFVYISFDVLIRFLEYKGIKVSYTQNVTDINDRDNDILKRAKEQNIPWQDLSKLWTQRFLDDMRKLNWRKPDNYLYASQNIRKMADFVQKLIDKGLAYRVDASVYLDISRIKDYGKLSRLNRIEMLKIAKDYEEDVGNPDKKHPLDITLWRKSDPRQPSHIPSFESPFGKGRPGWHVECSVMAIMSLGERIDIHGGGRDLIFPHHEAEIAQSEGATGKKPFAQIWMHSGIISYGGEKMSKSLGNLILVSNLLEKYDPSHIRFMLLSNHYRKDWDFDYSKIEGAKIKFGTIEKALSTKIPPTEYSKNNIIDKFESLMENDLDTPGVLNLVYSASLDILSGKEKSRALQGDIKKILRVLGFAV